MKILKFWYAACTIFCLYSLNTLVKERYEVAILSSNQSKTDPTSLLICKELNSFQLNKTEIHLEELRDELVNHFNRSKSSVNGLVNGLKTGRYLIFNGLLCILLKENDDRLSMNLILSPAVFFTFKSSTLDFVQMANYWVSFDQLTVQKKGPPYSSCSESNWRFRCLNECFKSSFRLSRYFYDGNETGLIHLNPETNQTIEGSEKSCSEKCWRENCEIVQFIPTSREGKTTTLEAHPKLSEFDVWVQFIDLACSFVNISLNQLASMAIKFATWKVKTRKVRTGLIYLKWAILFLSLACCGYLYTTMFLGYKADERNPTRKEITRNHIKQKVFRLAICVNIREYFTRSYFLDLNLLNKTMSEIEKHTDGALDDHLVGIYLNYQERMFRMDYILEPKIFFKKFLLYYKEIICRCFSLFIQPDYPSMPSNPKLTIKLKNWEHQLFLLAEKENLNENTFEYTSKRDFIKKVVKRLKLRERCVNYQEKYANCTSRLHCVERCTNRDSLEKFKKIVIGKTVVVDRDQVSPENWTKAYPMEFPARNPGSNHRTYVNISQECKKKFRDENLCVEEKFIETVDIVLTDPQTKEIDLFLDVTLSIEEFSWFKLLLDILNIQSIFFGMTALKLLRMLYSLIKPKLQFLKRMRNDKIAQFFIYLLCSIGFTWHTYLIFDLSINRQLTYNQYFEITKQTQMPVLVFCHRIDEKLIDSNHKLTGNYLEQLTSEMTAESVFKSITYLNESSQWTSFDFSLVEPFFFLHLKCFRIAIDQEYDRRQFHFSANSQALKVLKVDFTNRLLNLEKKKTVYFMTKTHETEFSNVLNLVYDYRWNTITEYSAEQSELTVNYEDRFSLIKRLLSIPYEDHFNDLDGQLLQLNSSGYDFGTLKNPLEKKDFNFELQDDLMDQFFSQVQKVTSNLLDSLDYQQTFVFNHLNQIYNSESGLIFSLVSIKKTLSAKNEENFAKLVLNLLNVLFLWFDLGVLDLHPIFILSHDYFFVYLYLHFPVYLFNKITQLFIFSHKWLKKFEPPLYELLKPRKKRNSPKPYRF